MEEIWLPIIEYEDSYEISNNGKIKSLDRFLLSGFSSVRSIKGQILKPKIDKDGYQIICLHRSQGRKYISIHRLVALHFILNIENKPEVNHIDGNKFNNSTSNLEWVTSKENNQHAWKIGLRDHSVLKGEKSNFSKLKKEDIEYIRANYNKKFCNQKCLAKKFNVTDSNISRILKNKTWQ